MAGRVVGKVSLIHRYVAWRLRQWTARRGRSQVAALPLWGVVASLLRASAARVVYAAVVGSAAFLPRDGRSNVIRNGPACTAACATASATCSNGKSVALK